MSTPDPELERQELEQLHSAGVLTDAELADAETRVPALAPDPPLPAAQPAQDAPSATETAPSEPVDQTGHDAPLSPAEQELAATGTLGPTEQQPEPPTTLDQIEAYWEQNGPWAPQQATSGHLQGVSSDAAQA